MLSIMDVLISLEQIRNVGRHANATSMSLEDICKSNRLDLNNINRHERWRLFLSSLDAAIEKHRFSLIWEQDLKKISKLILEHSLHEQMRSSIQNSIDQQALADKNDFLARLESLNLTILIDPNLERKRSHSSSDSNGFFPRSYERNKRPSQRVKK